MGKSFGSYGFLNSEMRSPSPIAKVDPQGMPVRIFHKSIVSPSLKCICIYIYVYKSQIVSNSAWQMNLWYIAPAAAFETLQSEEFKSSAGTWRCSSPFPTVLRCPKPSFWCKWTIIISNNSPSSSQINCSHKKKTLSQGLFTASCWMLSPFKWGWFNFVGLLTGPPWPHSSQGRCAAEHLFYPGAALTFASHATSFQGTNEAHWITVLGSSPFKGATWVPPKMDCLCTWREISYDISWNGQTRWVQKLFMLTDFGYTGCSQNSQHGFRTYVANECSLDNMFIE